MAKPAIGERWIIRDASKIQRIDPSLWVPGMMDHLLNTPLVINSFAGTDGRLDGTQEKGELVSWRFNVGWLEPVNPSPKLGERWILKDESRIRNIDSSLWDSIMQYAINVPIKVCSGLMSSSRFRGEPQVLRPGTSYLEQWTFNINWLDPLMTATPPTPLDLATFTKLLQASPEA